MQPYKVIHILYRTLHLVSGLSTVFGVPCLTLRPSTERPVTVEVGTATVVDLDADLIEGKTEEVLGGTYKKGAVPELWDGAAARRIVEVLVERLFI